MSSEGTGDAPNDWPGYYRGYRLRANPDGDVWWQVYQGTERLYLEPTPGEIVDRLIRLKTTGGRFHITEEQDVLTRVEESNGGYREVWVGELDLDGELIPAKNPDERVPIRPDNLSPGDLWPSVYDGARFSYLERDRIWWQNPDSHRRHYVEDPLPKELALQFRRFKPQGGSFRVTPWKDVITLIPFHPRRDTIDRQFSELPEVVRGIIKLRKERGVEMLPIYLGTLEDYSFNIQEPADLSEPLSPKEKAELESWAKNLGRTSLTDLEDHRVSDDEPAEGTAGRHPDEDVDFDDDPLDWDNEEDDERGDGGGEDT